MEGGWEGVRGGGGGGLRITSKANNKKERKTVIHEQKKAPVIGFLKLYQVSFQVSSILFNSFSPIPRF